MRGGLARWKRGEGARGARHAIEYAFEGACDSHIRSTTGVEALAIYSQSGEPTVSRFICASGRIGHDELDHAALRLWVDGFDPLTGAARGVPQTTPRSDLVLDGTINAPKTYSIAALLHPELSDEFEALQDRLRDRIILTWQRELNARRGHGGVIREELARVEVVELKHRRSRALDPHIHRHLWLNAKVLGRDGRWSTVDSRVAMKLHTLINAEGELAARTDPQWISALARHGYSLDDAGEIRQLAQAVGPLSRRSNQIETQRARLLAEWHAEHPSQQPSHDVLQQIDRRAWAVARPNKPAHLDEDEWEHAVRIEVAAIDPALLAWRAPIEMRSVAVGALDRDLVAAKAIVDADSRSASTGGRFSEYDIRAGATRAIAASRVVQDRAMLQELIDDIVARAREHAIDLLAGAERPAHIKGSMAVATAALKVDLGARLDALSEPGAPLTRRTITRFAAASATPTVEVDADQLDAAAAIAGTDRLVTITGPAGAGKTTVLRIAQLALQAQRRQMIVVAPTKKAASVAAREIGASASSLHALLLDHGWRWSRDPAGREQWTQLQRGEVDPETGRPHVAPTRYPLRRGDRIVVDEAGMVDLHTANALAQVAADTEAGIAMVGDHLQAAPVGHSGAMALMARRSNAVVELNVVHRFRDSEYAALTLRMREPASVDAARDVAGELDDRGHLRVVDSDDAARDMMADAWFRWARLRKRVALVTATNDEADAINEAIQQRRVDIGQLSTKRIALGRGEQRLLEGDIVQTRRNDRGSGVENRALWTVSRITPHEIELVSLSDSGDVRRVKNDYAADHLHLAYASTVHGIQGETTDASVVGPGVDAAGLYVGMTRGRLANEVVVVARTDAAAREILAETMTRGIPEVTIADAMEAARTELRRAAQAAPSAPLRVDPFTGPFTSPASGHGGQSIGR
ncbi:AAA family ATPase [Microbacterium pygmaeum]|uniref:TrwC relaxase n=1 Tax=Microbacterium pygmaeum TaxID=370764 RepID=A0A1G7X4P7_9MICO|nr:AAA family ATPase [Microbacterium pygmaeum]SDG79141.1 TrwC relaxase [Microbacterium pygmaeum]